MHLHVAQHINRNGMLSKLNQLSNRAANLVLYVLVRTPDEVVELYPTGTSQPLSRFCSIFRSTPEGERRCHECRSRVAAGACLRGLSEFTCHGGLSVFAAPAVLQDGRMSHRIIVAACVVARRSHASAWKTASRHVAGLGIDARRLKRACMALPKFTEATLPIVTGTIDLAATMLGEIEERLVLEVDRSLRTLAAPASRLAESTDHGDVRPPGLSTGSIVVDSVVTAIVRDPSLSHAVTAFARTSRITPNHLSTLFRQHTGKTFRAFLTEARIRHASALLRDVKLRVSEVALRAGFDDPAYFSRRFKQVTGCTPTEWRNGTRRKPSSM